MKKGYLFLTLRVLIWFLIVGWMAIVFIDYMIVKNSGDPIFCVKREVIKEDNGNIYICTGVGYKYYHHVKEEYVIKKFLPFWSKDNEE